MSHRNMALALTIFTGVFATVLLITGSYLLAVVNFGLSAYNFNTYRKARY